MPRTTINAVTYARKDLVLEIRKSAYAVYGSVRAWSSHTAESESTLRNRLRNPDDLTLGELRRFRKDLSIDKDRMTDLVRAML